MIRRAIKALGAGTTALLTTATAAFAQTKIDIPTGKDVGGVPAAFQLADIPPVIIKLLLTVAALAFFIWLILGGIRWITSGGDKTKTEEARNQITAALVGLVIVFAAWAIAQLINTFFGIDVFRSFTVTPLAK